MVDAVPSKMLSRACLALSVGLLVLSAYLGKQAALTTEQVSVSGLLGNPWYVAVLFCLGAHALVWPLALRTIPLTESWAKRKLSLCVRSLESLSSVARLLVDHLRAGATLSSSTSTSTSTSTSSFSSSSDS